MTKALIETSTLIAASIRALLEKQSFEHKYYSISKSLFNLFQSEIKLALGITTDTITEQSWNVLEKAIGNTVDEYKETGVDFYDTVSKIKDVAEDNLRKNIALLAKYPLDMDGVDKIQQSEVAPFFQKIDWTVQKMAHQHIPISGIRLKISTIKSIQRARTPYYKGTPDRMDKRILAEAIYLKRTFFSNERLLVASLDTHFSPAKKDTIVRDELNKSFDIYCDWPGVIYTELKKELKTRATNQTTQKKTVV